MQIKAGQRFYHAGDASMGRGDVWVVEKDAKDGEFATICYCGDGTLPDGHKWKYVDVLVMHDWLQEVEMSVAGRPRVVPGGIYHRELSTTWMWIGGNLTEVRHAGTTVMDFGDITANSEGHHLPETYKTTICMQMWRDENYAPVTNALIHEATEWAQRDMWLTPEVGGYLSWMLLHDTDE